MKKTFLVMSVVITSLILTGQSTNKLKENYYNVSVAMYTTKSAQTDNSPTITASGFKVSATNPKKHRIIAVSHDLKRKIKYGDSVKLTGIGKYSGIYIVRDLMNARFKQKIDILINPNEKAISFKQAKLYIL
jgi:3D (Asp-Asp-Asp) domain-containing protein